MSNLTTEPTKALVMPADESAKYIVDAKTGFIYVLKRHENDTGNFKDHLSLECARPPLSLEWINDPEKIQQVE